MNNNSIKMRWHKKNGKFENYNFGDELGPYIVNKLSGRKVDYIKYANRRIGSIKEFIYDVVIRKSNLFKSLVEFFKSFFCKEYIITVGSIISWYSSSRSIIWGSGILSRNDKISKAKRYAAVRGKHTLSKIRNFNKDINTVLGDPALLLPIVYTPFVNKAYLLGVIPHKEHYYHFKENIKNQKILIVNLNDKEVENVIDSICSCEYIISTSLHGLIISHCYNITSLWYKYEDLSIGGDDIKFLDYFSSVGIPDYEPYKLPISLEIQIDDIVKNIKLNKDKHLPQINLRKVQTDLLKCAPFCIKNEYLDY